MHEHIGKISHLQHQQTRPTNQRLYSRKHQSHVCYLNKRHTPPTHHLHVFRATHSWPQASKTDTSIPQYHHVCTHLHTYILPLLLLLLLLQAPPLLIHYYSYFATAAVTTTTNLSIIFRFHKCRERCIT
jgi:hypothetical protein